ncbi:phosphoribosyl anthranilate isomerase [Punctularia strigosozonata HHB-11173 SS5]|uniref:phosphoribosyl anthranilate isomerase n=1 Tax=Punctularia strigosozonata (strain HHB-11173) TaxID=741275 RepID=UPI000441669F|nr:phosphoribosyl anthranilate isomerase [Punctularia strigosozonata HHB-11173 SS5]EIN06657.1 phosphoribosyl anthranilate isomerase [Punctularia strigosozonata HHB-11173 SS5]
MSTSTLPPNLQGPLDVLMIDNFDSFTWNLYQQLCLLGAKVTVIRNDAIPVEALPELQISHLIISPGPGHPKTDSGISREAIKHFTGKVPVLGVCMGLECIVDVFGGEIGYAGEIMHGKLSRISHDNRGCFKNVRQGIQSTRYHSLSAAVKTLPDDLQVTAITEGRGVIMGVRHRKYTLEAVQYHPESILSEGGDDLVKNFLTMTGGTWEENPQLGVLDPELPAFDPKPSANGTALPTNSKVPSILDKIYAQRLRDVEIAKATPGTTPADLATLLSMHLAPPLVPVVNRLKSRTPALMAEIKRASPSKGAIAMNTNAAQQALTYALAGASVISVLTEPTWFKGTLLDMRLVREVISTLPNRPAVLRKDFILDEYQIAEARLNGADTILLIVAMLSPERLAALYAYSLSLGMEPLVEVNSAAEMERALELGARIIGVNNRNLHDFNVDMGTTSRLADMTKGKDVVLCALSGISAPEDVRQYVSQGVGAVLVGESLMRANDTRAFIRELLDWPEVHTDVNKVPLVKICGIRQPEEALAAAEAGADMLGLMLVPSSKRAISLEQAQKISSAVRATRASQPLPPPPDTADDIENEPWFTSHARTLSKTIASRTSRPLLVGVFQNQPLSYIQHVVSVAQLDMVQLHGSEPSEWVKHLPVPVVKVFHVDRHGRGLEGITRAGLHQFVLLDSVREDASGLSGGSGKIVDLDLAKTIVQVGEITVDTAHPSSHPIPGPVQNNVLPTVGVETDVKKPGRPMPIILAGGLTPDNVREAVERVGPWAVDVSGGVETADGNGKDVEKIRTFVKAAKGEGFLS